MDDCGRMVYIKQIWNCSLESEAISSSIIRPSALAKLLGLSICIFIQQHKHVFQIFMVQKNEILFTLEKALFAHISVEVKVCEKHVKLIRGIYQMSHNTRHSSLRTISGQSCFLFFIYLFFFAKVIDIFYKLSQIKRLSNNSLIF